MPTVQEFLPWAAGFFDGEGCIGIYVMGDGLTRLQVQTSQRVEDPVQMLRQLFGGSVCLTTQGYWQHTVFGPTAADMLRRIRPWLLVKGAQADLAVRFAELKKADPRHEDFPLMAEKMRELKRPWLKVVGE